ncbi:hypothetical protein DIPPA_27729 [Diplonema papillatum]|nr:hypothetical protein DIPPA_27729 [Diplonema papillatum]
MRRACFERFAAALHARSYSTKLDGGGDSGLMGHLKNREFDTFKLKWTKMVADGSVSPALAPFIQSKFADKFRAGQWRRLMEEASKAGIYSKPLEERALALEFDQRFEVAFEEYRAILTELGASRSQEGTPAGEEAPEANPAAGGRTALTPTELVISEIATAAALRGVIARHQDGFREVFRILDAATTLLPGDALNARHCSLALKAVWGAPTAEESNRVLRYFGRRVLEDSIVCAVYIRQCQWRVRAGCSHAEEVKHAKDKFYAAALAPKADLSRSAAVIVQMLVDHGSEDAGEARAFARSARFAVKDFLSVSNALREAIHMKKKKEANKREAMQAVAREEKQPVVGELPEEKQGEETNVRSDNLQEEAGEKEPQDAEVFSSAEVLDKVDLIKE